jgi:hypothetical protein
VSQGAELRKQLSMTGRGGAPELIAEFADWSVLSHPYVIRA